MNRYNITIQMRVYADNEQTALEKAGTAAQYYDLANASLNVGGIGCPDRIFISVELAA